MIHVQYIEDSNGDLVDVDYFCSGFCYTEHTGESSYGHAIWDVDSDYDVYCASCDSLIRKGLSVDD